MSSRPAHWQPAARPALHVRPCCALPPVPEARIQWSSCGAAGMLRLGSALCCSCAALPCAHDTEAALLCAEAALMCAEAALMCAEAVGHCVPWALRAEGVGPCVPWALRTRGCQGAERCAAYSADAEVALCALWLSTSAASCPGRRPLSGCWTSLSWDLMIGRDLKRRATRARFGGCTAAWWCGPLDLGGALIGEGGGQG